MKAKYDISIILVNYNGKKYIDNLFESLEKMRTDDLSVEIVFADNASSDGSVEYLRKQCGNSRLNIHILETGGNYGFAGGNNRAVEACSGEYIVLLNNDTAVTEDWLVNLYAFMKEHPDCGMANAKLLFFYDFVKFRFDTQDKILIDRKIEINGESYTIDAKFCKNALCEKEHVVCFGHTEICIPLVTGHTDYEFSLRGLKFAAEDRVWMEGLEEKHDLAEQTVFRVGAEEVAAVKFALVQNAGSGINECYNGYDIGFGEHDGEQYQTSYELTNGCGAAIMMKKEDFMSCGMFDEIFFMYYEDTDLSYRMRRMGKKILFCPSSIVRHIHTGSSTEWSPFFVYHVYRNKLLFIYKNISKRVFWEYFLKGYGEGVLQKDKMKRRGSVDAVKLAIFKRPDVKFRK